MEEKNGAYDLEGVIWHQHSNLLLIEIMKYFSKEIPVVDIGCGHNFYVSALNYAGWSAIGCDLVDLNHKSFFIQDATEDITYLGTNKLNVISLEVGEHIPLQKTNEYIDNICRFKGNVIMSWATPGQAGVGHINCQTNDWVVNEMHKRGYKLNGDNTASLRQAVKDCHCTWFHNTLMYFTCE